MRKFIYDNMKNIIDKVRLTQIRNAYHPADFIFELVQLKEIFLAKRVLELYDIFSPYSEAILSCSRVLIKNYISR